MTISSHPVADRVHQITLGGLLTWAEFQAFLARAETENVFASGKVRVLIQLENFAGSLVVQGVLKYNTIN